MAAPLRIGAELQQRRQAVPSVIDSCSVISGKRPASSRHAVSKAVGKPWPPKAGDTLNPARPAACSACWKPSARSSARSPRGSSLGDPTGTLAWTARKARAADTKALEILISRAAPHGSMCTSVSMARRPGQGPWSRSGRLGRTLEPIRSQPHEAGSNAISRFRFGTSPGAHPLLSCASLAWDDDDGLPSLWSTWLR